MGKIEKSPRHEALPSTRNLFPINIIPINRSVKALRDARNPLDFILQEQQGTDPAFNTYLEQYFSYFEHAQRDTLDPVVDKESFFVGAMLVKRIMEEQAYDLNAKLAKGLNKIPSLDQTVELPHFEDSGRLFASEISALNFWQAEEKLLDSHFGAVASERVLQLTKSDPSESDCVDNVLGHVLFYVSALSNHDTSFYTGAGAAYFAVRHAVEENQSFEEILSSPRHAA